MLSLDRSLAAFYRVISTVAQRNGEISSGMGAILILGQSLIDRLRVGGVARNAVAGRRLVRISPLRSGSAGPPVEMTMTAFFEHK